jgi:hypothetical protein
LGQHSPRLSRPQLKRDAPEFAEALARGEFRSAPAAGFKVYPTRLMLARRAWKKMSPEDRATFLAEIGASPAKPA